MKHQLISRACIGSALWSMNAWNETSHTSVCNGSLSQASNSLVKRKTVAVWHILSNCYKLWNVISGHEFGSARHYTQTAIQNIQQNFLLPSLELLRRRGLSQAGGKVRSVRILHPAARESTATFDLFSVSSFFVFVWTIGIVLFHPFLGVLDNLGS